VIAEGDDEIPPREGSAREVERDVLAERRARRAGPGEAAEIRRADAAEAAIHALERQLADLRRREQEAERERERTSEQLSEREHELRRVKQREYAEQQLRVEAEENVTRLRRRQREEIDGLQRHVAEARAAMQSTGERADELRVRAEQERDEAERRRKEAERALASAERQRLHAEQLCATLTAHLRDVSASCTRLREGMLVLERAAATLRTGIEEEREVTGARIRELEVERESDGARVRELEHEREATALRIHELECERTVTTTRIRELEHQHQPASTPPQAVDREVRREEMAGALAAAVERLRARVAEVGETEADTREPEVPAFESEAPAPESEVSAPVPEARAPKPGARAPEPAAPVAVAPAPTIQVVPRQLTPPTHRTPWLAAAIRAIAERRDARLAAELITELLPAQRLVVDRPLSYGLWIAELDTQWRATFGQGRSDIDVLSAAGKSDLDFELRGRAVDFAELAAGGAGRRLSGVEVRGSRRRLRALRRARQRPLELWDLASAGIDVWPGLLLLALAEAIDPRWSVGERFTIAFEVDQPAQGTVSATLHVQVRDGAPLAVSSTPHEPPAATVRLSERAFMCMLAGTPLPVGARILLDGDPGTLELLIEWVDRAQGRSSATASLRRSRV
jgi:hypothetical protein